MKEFFKKPERSTQAILVVLICCACGGAPRFDPGWTASLPNVGSSSSPQCADLNGDGVLDVIIGASLNEFQKSDSSVIALDGKTGKLLWNVFARDQIVGSATLLDITGDGVKDVFIGGRSSEFIAINGATGKTIWRYIPLDTNPVHKLIRFNFFNAQIIADQDQDGLPDLLFTNGGNAKARAKTRVDRYPGVLAIFSSKTGSIIAADTVPDGNETYMSPVIADLDDTGKSMTIVFGTGGETLGGHLYRTTLADLLKNNISGSIMLDSENGRGFIAPATIADVNNDQVKDIIVNWFGGKMIALDGKTNSVLWTTQVPATESYNTAVPGFFNDDNTPDFFSTYNKGAWPDNRGSIQMLINGKDGSILRSDSLGCIGYASAVVVDANGDGADEVIWTTNNFNCNPPLYLGGPDLVNDHFSLMMLDYKNNKLREIVSPMAAKNISSTPWIGDVDNNGELEVIYCIQRNAAKVDQYNGIQVSMLRTTIKSSPRWPGYMGDGSGVFSQQRRATGN